VSDRVKLASCILLGLLSYSTQFHLTYFPEFGVSYRWSCVDASTCSPLPSSGYRGRPLREPCGSPPSTVLLGRKTARLPVAAASGLPWQQVSARRGFVRFPWGGPSSPGTWSSSGWARPTPTLRQRQGALLGSQEIPLEACPGLGTPATLAQPRIKASSRNNLNTQALRRVRCGLMR